MGVARSTRTGADAISDCISSVDNNNNHLPPPEDLISSLGMSNISLFLKETVRPQACTCSHGFLLLERYKARHARDTDIAHDASNACLDRIDHVV